MSLLTDLYRGLRRRAIDFAAEATPATGDVLVVVDREVRQVAYGTPSDGDVLTVDTSSPTGWTVAAPSGGGGGGGAPVGASYLTLGTNGTLTSERVLTLDTGLSAVDGGAGGAYTVSLAANLVALAGLASTGLVALTSAGVLAVRSIAVSGTGLSVTNPAGVAGNPTIALDTDAVLDLLVDDRFGDGGDGAVTLASATTTLGRDMQYASLDLAGKILDTNGYRVRVSGTLSDSVGGGTIRNNGGNSTAHNNGIGAPANSIGGGSNGGAGGNAGAAGSNGSSKTNVWALQPVLALGASASRGGAGGVSGGGQNAGTPGTIAVPDAGLGYGGWYFWDTLYWPSPAGGSVRAEGGSGGSGGGCQAGAGARGGGGGGGGGICGVWAKTVNLPSSTKITANGGNGGNGTAGAAAGTGGGGGGGGGGVALVCCKVTSAPTLEALGGNGGTATGAGSNGSSGNNGYTVTHTTRL